MGIGLSAASREQRLKNSRIEEEMSREQHEARNTIKLLLLGAGECGKSTILKQMRILHTAGFTEEEYQQQKGVIYSNILQSMAAILKGMAQLEIPHGDINSETDAILVLATNQQLEALPTDLACAIKRLWADTGVLLCYERASEYQLNDSAKYFLDNLDRIQAPDFRPTQQDILRARAKTSGIVEVDFELKDVKFRVFDVGGQRSERRKWIHCFDNVNAIIFISAMSEYDQVLREDDKTNRMQESLRLFESICNSQFFLRTQMILFLNKKDLFEEKIKKTPLKHAFPDYSGEQTAEACGEFITHRFSELNQNAQRKVYDHQTCGTDTNQIQHILDSTVDTIIARNLKLAGI